MKNIHLYFVLFILVVILLNFIFNELIINDNLIFGYLEEQVSYERILLILDRRNKWSWLNYLLIPILYLLKFFLISLWILCGSIIVDYRLKFKSIFEVVIISEFFWLIPLVLTIVWFGFFHTTYSMTDLNNFAPLSLLSIFEAGNIESWLIFPLKSINLFELVYLFVLALFFKYKINKDFDTSLRFMLPVYGSAFLIWIISISFISINLSV